MLKQPPCISSSAIFRVRAFSELGQLHRQLHDVLVIGVFDHRHQQPAIGIDGHADDVLLRMISPAVMSIGR